MRADLFEISKGYLVHLEVGPQAANEQEAPKCSAKTELYYVLDRSGSMAGTPWSIIKNTFKEMPPSMAILYNHKASLVPTKDLDQYQADGMTYFNEAFKCIQQLILKESAPLSFVFMTDGQDTSNSPLQLGNRFIQLEDLKKKGKKFVFHTIGFSEDHDRKFLERIKSVGSTEGTFQYAKTAMELKEQLKILTSYLEDTQWVTVNIEYPNGQSMEFNLETNSNRMLEFVIPKDRKPVVITCNSRKTCDIKLYPKNKYALLYELMELPISSFEEANAVLNQLKELNRRWPNQEMETVALLQDKLDKAYQVLRDQTLGALETQNLLSHVSGNVQFKKTRRERLMNRRTIQNKDILLVEQKLEKHYATLGKVFPNEVKDISCFISLETLDNVLLNKEEVDLSYQNNGAGLMQKETIIFNSKYDLMGRLVSFARLECIIDAPTLIRITRMSSSYVTKTAFEEAIRMKSAQLEQAPWQTMGGFTSEENSPLEDMGRQKNNAWLPIYGCPEHFERVRITLKPILGWLFTLDPMGFTELQYLGLYSILGQMALLYQRQPLEANLLILKDFTLLCRGLLPDAGMAVKQLFKLNTTVPDEHQHDLCQTFVNHPEYRQSEYTQSLFTYLGWAIASENKSVELQKRLTEEIFRKVCSLIYKSRNQETLFELAQRLVFPKVQEDSQSACIEDNNEMDRQFDKAMKWYETHIDNPQTRALKAKETVQLFKQSISVNGISTKIKRKRVLGSDEVIKLVQQHPMKQALDQVMLYHFKGTHCQELDLVKQTNLTVYGLLAAKHDQIVKLEPNPLDHGTLYLKPLKNEIDLRDAKSDKDLEQLEQTNLLAKLALKGSLSRFLSICLSECPTRGGMFFQALFDQLNSKEEDFSNILTKLYYLLSGHYSKGNRAYTYLSDGMAHNGTPREKLIVKNTLLPDEYQAFCDKMSALGTCGHVYRESDKPNRHGYHRSHPNPKLVYKIDWKL